MKTILLLMCATVFAAAADRRDVDGVIVDVTAVQEWAKSHKGERPMPHWRFYTVTELKGPMVGGQLCGVKGEGGETGEVVVAHLPPAVTTYLQQAAAAKKAAEVSAETARELKQETRWVNRRRAALLRREAAVASDQAAAAAKSAKTTESHREVVTRILAMNTGRKASQFDIVECGVPVAGPK
jgi:hypothetical protein